MRAAHRLDGDGGLTVGAELGRRSRRGWLFVQCVEHLQHHKQHKCHDQKVDDRIQKRPQPNGHIPDGDAHLGEIRIKKQSDDRGDDIPYQRVDDGCKCRADHNTYRHIQHIAPHGKGFEFGPELFELACLHTAFLLFLSANRQVSLCFSRSLYYVSPFCASSPAPVLYKNTGAGLFCARQREGIRRSGCCFYCTLVSSASLW